MEEYLIVEGEKIYGQKCDKRNSICGLRSQFRPSSTKDQVDDPNLIRIIVDIDLAKSDTSTHFSSNRICRKRGSTA